MCSHRCTALPPGNPLSLNYLPTPFCTSWSFQTNSKAARHRPHCKDLIWTGCGPWDGKWTEPWGNLEAAASPVSKWCGAEVIFQNGTPPIYLQKPWKGPTKVMGKTHQRRSDREWSCSWRGVWPKFICIQATMMEPFENFTCHQIWND